MMSIYYQFYFMFEFYLKLQIACKEYKIIINTEQKNQKNSFVKIERLLIK